MKNETSGKEQCKYVLIDGSAVRVPYQKLLSFWEGRRDDKLKRERSKHHLSRRFTTKSAKTSSSQELIEDVVDEETH